MTALAPPLAGTTTRWGTELLDGLDDAGISHLPYLPDKPLSAVVAEADRREGMRTIPLTREEEGVGIAVGLHLTGVRSALMMQASGMGNSLNAIGSVAVAQRVPLLVVVTERGGLGEAVSTQIPFGAALPQVLAAMAVRCTSLVDPAQVRRQVELAAELAFTSRVTVVLHVTSQLIKATA